LQKKRKRKRRKTAENHKKARIQREIAIILLITLIVIIAGSRYRNFREEPLKEGYVAYVSDDVKAYEDDIRTYAQEYNIEAYVPVLEAIMEQESHGKSTDLMQSSECMFNTKYEQTAGSITDPEYSIDVGTQYFAYCLNLAGCTDENDFNRLYLAIQGYNYGHNYIEWTQDNYGKYCQESADEFANLMCRQLGWDSYGDRRYVHHVLRYLVNSD
jgi:hypothetical protein